MRVLMVAPTSASLPNVATAAEDKHVAGTGLG